MKRLVFCFDGSWNRIDAAHPTNVLFTAESEVAEWVSCQRQHPKSMVEMVAGCEKAARPPFGFVQAFAPAQYRCGVR